MKQALWTSSEIGGQKVDLLNLKNPEVDSRIIAEMAKGVEVFYDRRWEATSVLNEWLSRPENAEIYEGKRVFIPGAGIGAETVVLAKKAEHIWINDLAPVALELCGEQLEQNGLSNFTSRPGNYEEVAIPEVDLVVACFLIYNPETDTAMRRFLSKLLGVLL